MDDPKTYQIIVMDGETPLFKRTLTIWPDELVATEYMGMQIGRELSRDAIDHAGLFEAFLEQRKKVA